MGQILVGRPRPPRLPFGLSRQDLVFRLIEKAKDFQVTVVAERQPHGL